MDVNFNINRYVKVKLTDYGIEILKQKHDSFNERMRCLGIKDFGDFKLELDEDGYYKCQMHELMNTFGKYIGMAMKLPFETNIIICAE